VALFTFITDHRAIARELKRCADALERLAPPTGDDKVRTPADANDVSYATDEATAKQELLDELKGYEKEMTETDEG
jgi:hypothetical protein